MNPRVFCPRTSVVNRDPISRDNVTYVTQYVSHEYIISNRTLFVIVYLAVHFVPVLRFTGTAKLGRTVRLTSLTLSYLTYAVIESPQLLSNREIALRLCEIILYKKKV